MASQITHIPYTQKFMDKFLDDSKLDKQKFFLGALFPDIRYLGSIPREVTHQGDATIPSILNAPNDFERGRLVHIFIDIEREKIVNKLGLYDLLPRDNMVSSVLKFFEDQITYPLVSNWPEVISYFDSDAIPEELALIDGSVATRWHGLLRGYFSQPPTLDTALKVAVNLTLSNEQITRAKEMIQSFQGNSAISDGLRQVYLQLFND